MKGISLAIVVFFCLVNNVEAQYVERIYYFDKPDINYKDGYHTIEFKNTTLSGIPGEPVLPYQKISISLSQEQVADSIELIFEDKVIIPRKYQLYPAQYPIPSSEARTNQFLIKEQLYDSDLEYPENPKGKLITAYKNGKPFALSTFTPMRFNPDKRIVSYFRKVTVKIHTSTTTNQSLTTNHQPPTTNPPKSNNYQLLIITSPALENRFQSLIDLYLLRGIKSQVISTLNISQLMPGQDLQEKIRNYIIQEYQNNNIEYVLLGGDEEVVPSRGFYCEVQSTSLVVSYDIPADVYYSSLDGNWNTDNDSLWGEPGEEDLLPEVAVGRMVISDTNDLSNAFNKIISYQNNPVPGELRDPLLVGEHMYSNPLTWGGDYMDLLIGYRNDNGYITDGIPTDHNYIKLYDRDFGTWPKDTLISRINRGVSFIHHAGHANTYYLMRMNMSDITNTNFNSLDGNTHNFTLVYSHGCYSGAFDASDCIAEKMLNIERFALGFVGNSRYGWFNEGQTEGPSEHLHREFVNALYSEKINRLGATHMESKIATAPWVTLPGQWEEGALRYCFYSCNVLGDPAMAIWTDENIIVNATYQDTNQILTPVLQVLIDTNGIPMRDFTCALIKNGMLHGYALTDSLGCANIIFDPPVTDTGEAQLVVTGYNSLPAFHPVYFTNLCQAPFVYLGADTIINPGDTLILDPGPGYNSYLWSDGSSSQTLMIDTSGIYWVEVTDTVGCSGRDTIAVWSGYTISGLLEYKDTMTVSTPLGGVEIFLIDQNNTIIDSVITDSTGYYEFNSLFSGTYFFDVSIDKPWDGGNTLDALKVVFHFIGTNLLSELYLEAAEVNADNTVNTADALNIQMRFVGMINSFPAGDWIFEKDTLNVGGNSHCIYNFHAICVGDVDGSNIPTPKGGNSILQKNNKGKIIPSEIIRKIEQRKGKSIKVTEKRNNL